MMNDLYHLVSMLESFKIKYKMYSLSDYNTPLEFFNSFAFYSDDSDLPDYDVCIEFSDGVYFYNRFHFKNGQFHSFGIYE
ncbi:hypothetical protein [Bacillus phage vB_BanS-Thrax5]|nr:hypothetical protein [Bacillus phage vB_BanS-Thrax5]